MCSPLDSRREEMRLISLPGKYWLKNIETQEHLGKEHVKCSWKGSMNRSHYNADGQPWWEVEVKSKTGGFPGGIVVENLPANARDTDSSPGPGRSHMPRGNQTREPQLLSLHSRAREPQLLKPARLQPVLRNKRSHRSEKPAHRNKEQKQPK